MKIEEFRKERERLNKVVMDYSDTVTKRFFALDTQTYEEGALSKKQKELMGLVASIVLRCDDCILYHLIRAKEEGCTDKEITETADIGLIVGGSITIPHLRRMFDSWNEMKNMEEK
ncbi:MAG: carboxymuconolactone decarboxylase family protein [bacterium]|nr:carboxymuconolactone decarboxylase family protein [bacterium]